MKANFKAKLGSLQFFLHAKIAYNEYQKKNRHVNL